MHTDSFKKLEHPSIPESIYAGWSKLPESYPELLDDRMETLSGKELIRYMIQTFLNRDKMKIITEKYEKPHVECGEAKISASFSHTDNLVSGAISEEFVVGVDMEWTERDVNPKLLNRMRHIEEAGSLYQNHPGIQLWTLKESALKAIGTGLRKPMKSVKLEKESDFMFSVEFDDGKQAKICSFKENDQWISICYY